MGQQLYVTQTAETGVNPDQQDIKTVIASKVIKNQGQQRIRVSALIGIQTTATSQAQNVPIVITVGATTKTFTFQTKAVAEYDIIPVTYEINARGSTTVKIETGLVAADDAQTTVTGLYMSVEEVEV